MRMDVASTMVGAARFAPSIHNSQPWSFAYTDDGLEVVADRSRATPATDPLGRWLLMACGAAALNAAVAAGASGSSYQLEVLPDRDQPDLVARITLPGPVAPEPSDVELLAAVARRHTVRSPFTEERVPDALVEQLRSAVEREGAWMSVVSRPEDLVELAVLAGLAETAEAEDEQYQAELRTWLRLPGQDTSDGIPLSELPDAGQLRGADLPIRDFRGRPPDALSETSRGAVGAPPPVEHPLLVVIGSDGDQPADWVRAGLAMERLWLTATAAGLGASPMTQALDHAAPRAVLGRIVGASAGHPQILLRVGYATGSVVTGRRAVGDLVADPPAPAAS